MKALMGTRATWGTVPVRLALGIIFLAHGSQKMFGLFGGPGLSGTAQMMNQLGIPAFLAYCAAFAEFFGGLMILLGFLTRLGGGLISIVMLVAIFKVHWPFGLLTSAVERAQGASGFEYPLALLGAALALVIAGAGPLSVDRWLTCKSDKGGENP